MVGLLRRAVFCLIAWLAGAGLHGSARACPFCNGQGQTLTGEVNQASMVLFGTLANATEAGDGSTDLVIDAVIKSNAILGDRKTITLARYLPPPDGKYKFLVFCDVFKGKIDPYRGVAVKADSDIVKYLRGAVEFADDKAGQTSPKDRAEKTAKKLRFFFDYLDNADLEISNDAYREFANADYKDYRDMAAALPPERIARWLRDPKTPSFRLGLYASMLGHCGKDEHAALLRSLLEDPEKRVTSGVDGILAGYTMLKPAEGWKYLRGILQDPKKEFLLRYAALRAVRFFWDWRPDVVTKKDLVEGVSQLLNQGDIADFAVEDLRKWRQWELIDRVLGLQKTEAYQVPVVRRSILRFALSCPKECTAAASYVDEQRKKDAQAVADAEELLKLEQTK